MSLSNSEENVRCRLSRKYRLLASRSKSFDISSNTSYPGNEATLKQSQRERASSSSPGNRNSLTSSDSGSEGCKSESHSSSSSLQNVSSPPKSHVTSPPFSPCSDNDSEEDERPMAPGYGGIRIPSSPLVELNIHLPLLDAPKRKRHSYRIEPLKFTGSWNGNLPSRTTARTARCSLPVDLECKDDESFLDLSDEDSEEEDADFECDTPGTADEAEAKTIPRMPSRYTKTQLSLFGDFLRSPFAPISSNFSQTQTILGTSPFDKEPHSPCDCNTCLLLEVALTCKFSEPHPIASWIAENYCSEPEDEEDFGDSHESTHESHSEK